MGFLPMLHFFNNAHTLVPQGFDVGIVGKILDIPPVIDLVSVGFWLTLAGTLSIIVLPIFAAVFVPLKDNDPS